MLLGPSLTAAGNRPAWTQRRKVVRLGTRPLRLRSSYLRYLVGVRVWVVLHCTMHHKIQRCLSRITDNRDNNRDYFFGIFFEEFS